MLSAQQRLDLTAELQKVAYSTLTDQERFDALYATTPGVTVTVPIKTRDIASYLAIINPANPTDKFYPIVLAAEAGDVNAKTAMHYLREFAVEFDMTHPGSELLLTAVLDGLISSSLINATDKSYILAMKNQTLSIAQAPKPQGLGIDNLALADVMRART